MIRAVASLRCADLKQEQAAYCSSVGKVLPQTTSSQFHTNRLSYAAGAGGGGGGGGDSANTRGNTANTTWGVDIGSQKSRLAASGGGGGGTRGEASGGGVLPTIALLSPTIPKERERIRQREKGTERRLSVEKEGGLIGHMDGGVMGAWGGHGGGVGGGHAELSYAASHFSASILQRSSALIGQRFTGSGRGRGRGRGREREGEGGRGREREGEGVRTHSMARQPLMFSFL